MDSQFKLATDEFLKTNRKQQDSFSDEIDEENATAAIPIPSTKIIDINTDCLEKVFEFLELRDLINVADSNKYLQETAEVVFIRKSKKRMIIVEINEKRPFYSYEFPDFEIYDDAILIRNSLAAMKAIRLFGQHISEISLQVISGITCKPPMCKNFFVHVNEFCHKTLKILHLYGNISPVFAALEHPFENTETFIYRRGVIGKRCKHLSRLFPRLSQLKLYGVDVLKSKYFFRTFPNLDTLHWEKNDLTGISDSEFTFATRNPQLQSFGSYSYDNWKFINANRNNLKSVCGSFSSQKSIDCPPIVFNNVENLKVLCKNNFAGAVMPIDMFSFRRLKKMKLKCEARKLNMWFDFIVVHPSIEHLTIILHNTGFVGLVKCLLEIRDKARLVGERTKFISLRWNFSVYHETKIEELSKFLETHQFWFTEFSIEVEQLMVHCVHNHIKSKIEIFCRNIRQMKNYEIRESNRHDRLVFSFLKKL